MKLTNNRDQFASRGDPWEGLEKPKSVSPTGQLKRSRLALINDLINGCNGHAMKGNANETCSNKIDRPFDDDLFLGGHCLPIQTRLAKERNTLIPSINASSKPSSRSSDVIARAMANRRSKKAKHLIKVK